MSFLDLKSPRTTLNLAVGVTVPKVSAAAHNSMTWSAPAMGTSVNNGHLNDFSFVFCQIIWTKMKDSV